jgi:hypothetical protein
MVPDLTFPVSQKPPFPFTTDSESVSILILYADWEAWGRAADIIHRNRGEGTSIPMGLMRYSHVSQWGWLFSIKDPARTNPNDTNGIRRKKDFFIII